MRTQRVLLSFILWTCFFLTVTHIKKVHAGRTPSSPTPTRRPQGLLNELLHTITGLLSGVLNRAVVTFGPKVASKAFGRANQTAPQYSPYASEKQGNTRYPTSPSATAMVQDLWVVVIMIELKLPNQQTNFEPNSLPVRKGVSHRLQVASQPYAAVTMIDSRRPRATIPKKSSINASGPYSETTGVCCRERSTWAVAAADEGFGVPCWKMA